MEGQRHDPERRERRRADARRRVRRQRLLAIGALVAMAVAVAVVLVVRAGDPPSPAPLANAVATRDRPAPAKHRNRGAARSAEPARADSAPPDQPIPILMYHVVEAAPAGTPYPDLWIPAARFTAEIEMLRAKGYHAITMRDADDYWHHRRRIPCKPIVLSFDDGYRSHAEVARPALERIGWPGVLYLQVSALKTPGAEGISRRAVRSLLAAGWEIGAHTITHPDLTTLAPDALREEVAGSRRMIHETFDVPIDSFAYPAGKLDAGVEAAVHAAGYRTAVTVEEGAAKPGDPLTLPRIRVHAGDTPDSLAARLAAAGA